MKIKNLLPILGIFALLTSAVVIKNQFDLKDKIKEKNDLVLVQENSDTYRVSNHLSTELIESAEKIIVHAELNKEYTPEYMLSISDAVVLASVISVDGADMEHNRMVGNTYGKMVINNNIYGTLSNGTVVNYMKSGGIMTVEEREKYDDPEAKEKRNRLRQQAGIDISQDYISSHIGNDPEIEEGKTYLCYLKYRETENTYEIIGLGNGFREVNIPQANIVSAQSLVTNDYKIKNNDTGTYESLTDYINKYINIK